MLMIERIQNFEGYFINDEGTTYIAFSMKEEDEVWSYLMTEEEFKRVWADKTAAQSWKNFKFNNLDTLAVWREPYKGLRVPLKFAEGYTLPIMQERGKISEQKAGEMFNKLPLKKFDWVFVKTSTGISLKIFHSYTVVKGQIFYKVFDYISDGRDANFWDNGFLLTRVTQPFVIKAKDDIIPSATEVLRQELVENYVKETK